jgi:CheY-like chemotaxis protein
MMAETRRRVLLVDDEPALARVFARALVAADFEVDLAVDGVEGLNMLKGGGYDVLVSDVCMPRMNGLRLLDIIRKLRPDIPVVLMTAQLHPPSYERARELGTVRYLLKPFTLEQLARAVGSAARLRAAWQRSTARRQAAEPR